MYKKAFQIIFSIFLLLLVSCNLPKPKHSLIINDLKYSGYYWHVNYSSHESEFYLDHYIDIDESGHFIIMRHDKWRGGPTFFSGEINDTIRRQIDSTFIDKKYNREYFPPFGAIMYDGLTYCIDYKQGTAPMQFALSIIIALNKLACYHYYLIH